MVDWRSGVIGAFLVGITWGIYVAYPIYTCYLVPAEVTNRVYSANLSYLERHQESEFLELSADKIKEWKRLIESLPLVADAVYVYGDAKNGTWRITFEHYKSCLDSGDVLELAHELVADGTARVNCKTRFKNAKMIPFQCRE
jgi:hypothetical protein